MIDPPAHIDVTEASSDGTAGLYTPIPFKTFISLELKVSPATVVETVSVFNPGLLKSKNSVRLPLIKS